MDDKDAFLELSALLAGLYDALFVDTDLILTAHAGCRLTIATNLNYLKK